VIATLAQGFEALLTARHHVALLARDCGAETGGGLRLCRDARAAGCSIAIVVLARGHDVATRIECRDAGADGYIADDACSQEELQLRIEDAILWSEHRHRAPLSGFDVPTRFEHGPLTICLATQSVFLGGVLLHLTKVERKLLLCLSARRGDVVPHAELCRAAAIQPDLQFRNLNNSVRRLRQRLSEYCEVPIRSVRGRGYVIPSHPRSVAQNCVQK